MADDDFQDAPPPGGTPVDIGEFQDAPPPGGTPVSMGAGDFHDEPPPGGTPAEAPEQPPQQPEQPPARPESPSFLNDISSGFVSGLGHGVGSLLRGAAELNEALGGNESYRKRNNITAPIEQLSPAYKAGQSIDTGTDVASDWLGGDKTSLTGRIAEGVGGFVPAAAGAALTGGAGAALELPAIVGMVLGGAGAAGVMGAQGAASAADTSNAFNATPEQKASNIKASAALAAATGFGQGALMMALGPLAAKVPGVMGYLASAAAEGTGFTTVAEVQKAAQAYVDRATGVNPDASYQTSAEDIGVEAATGALFGAGGRYLHGTPHAAPGKEADPEQAAADQKAVETPSATSNAGSPSLGTAATAVPPDDTSANPLKPTSKTPDGRNDGGYHVGTGDFGREGAKRAWEAGKDLPDEEEPDELDETATHTASSGVRVIQPGEVTPEVTQALSAVMSAPEEKPAAPVEPTPAAEATPVQPGERVNFASAGAQRLTRPSQAPELTLPPGEPTPLTPQQEAKLTPPPVLPAPPRVQPPPTQQPVTPNRTQELIQRRIAARQAKEQQQASPAAEAPRQEPAGAPEATGGPEIAQTPEATQQPPNALQAVRAAADDIARGQGGISTAFVGDIKDRVRSQGITPEQVDAAIADEARNGRATLAQSSTTRMTPSQRDGALDVGGDKYHTVTFKQQPVTPEVTKAAIRRFVPATEAPAPEPPTAVKPAPRILEDLTAGDDRAVYDEMERERMAAAGIQGRPVEETAAQATRNQVANAQTSGRHPVMDGRGNQVSNESTALKALDRTTSYQLADHVADQRPFPEDINPRDPDDRERLKQYAQDFMADLNGRKVEAPDPRNGRAYQGKTLTMGWSEFKGMRPKDPNHATGQLLAQELNRIANKKGPVSPADAAELLSRAAAIKAGRAGDVRQERSQQARETMQGRGQIKEATPVEGESTPEPSVVWEGRNIAPTDEGRAQAAEDNARAIAEGRFVEGEGKQGQVAKSVVPSTADKRAQQAELRKLRDRFNAEPDPVRKADLGRQLEEARVAAGGKITPGAEKLVTPEVGDRLSQAYSALKDVLKEFGSDEGGGLRLPKFSKKGAEAFDTMHTYWPGLVNTEHWARQMDPAWKPGTNPGRDFSNATNKWGTAHAETNDRYQKMMADPWLKFADKNPQEAVRVSNLIQNEIRARMWADLPMKKQFQGRAAEKRLENVWKQQLHTQNEKDYKALTPAGRSMRAQMFNAVDVINRELSSKRANDVLEHDGINAPGLADRITDNKYSPQDIATLGQEKLDAIREATNPHADGSPYLPFIHEGDNLVMGRRKMVPPTTASKDLSDPATGRIKYEFKTRGDAEDYAKTLHNDAPASAYVVDKRTGDRTYQTTDPTTGNTTTHTFTSEDLKSDLANLEKRYAVTARKDGQSVVKNGDIHAPFDHVEAFHTKREADAARDQMIKSGEFEDVVRRTKEYQEKGGGHPDLLNMMGTDGDKILSKNNYFQGMSDHQQAQMRDVLHQNMIAVQSGNRLVNPKMHRSGIGGYNKDLGRSMDAFTRKAAAAATTLDHLRPAQEALKGIQQQARDAGKAASKARAAGDEDTARTEELKERAMTNGYNTLEPRIAAIINHSITPQQAATGPALHRILSWSSISRLFHPMFWVQHASQNAMFSPVTLAAGAMEHNLTGGAAGALKYFGQELAGKYTNLPRMFAGGLGQAANNVRGIDNTAKLSDTARQQYTNPIHQKAFDDLRDFGAIPSKPIKSMALTENENDRHGANLESIFGSSADGPRALLRTGAEKTVDAADAVRHVIEHVFEPTVNAVETHNRTTTAMAAFRQHYDTYGDYDKALDYAKDRTSMSHANYQITNKPAWMQQAQKNAALAPALQFKSFPAMAYDNLFKGLADLRTPGRRAAGATLIGGLVATHAIAAGLAGIPFVETLRLAMDAARMAGLTKYSWDDVLEKAMEGVHALTGSKTVSQAAVHGLPNFAGVDLSPQLGEHGILFGSPTDTGKERDLDNSLKQWGFSLATGATGEMFTDLFKGARNIVDGDPISALNAVPIRALKDVNKAVGGYLEGKKNEKGQQINPPYTLPQAVAKGAGFTLSSDSEAGFAAHEASVARNRQTDMATKLKDAWLTADTPEARSAAWKAAIAEGLKPKDLIQAKTQVMKSGFASKNINDIPVSRKTKPIVAPIANTLSGW